MNRRTLLKGGLPFVAGIPLLAARETTQPPSKAVTSNTVNVFTRIANSTGCLVTPSPNLHYDGFASELVEAGVLLRTFADELQNSGLASPIEGYFRQRSSEALQELALVPEEAEGIAQLLRKQGVQVNSWILPNRFFVADPSAREAGKLVQDLGIQKVLHLAADFLKVRGSDLQLGRATLTPDLPISRGRGSFAIRQSGTAKEEAQKRQMQKIANALLIAGAANGLGCAFGVVISCIAAPILALSGLTIRFIID